MIGPIDQAGHLIKRFMALSKISNGNERYCEGHSKELRYMSFYLSAIGNEILSDYRMTGRSFQIFFLLSDLSGRL